MSLSVKVKLDKVLEPITGTSTRGEWKKLEFVGTTLDDQYPKTIAFTLFGDKTNLIEGFQVGQELDVSFNLESREHQGRYFHNVNAWRIQPAMNDAASATGQPPVFDPSAYATPQAAPQANADDDDNLPF